MFATRLNDDHKDPVSTPIEETVVEKMQGFNELLEHLALPGIEFELEENGEDSFVSVFDAETTQLIFEVYCSDKKGQDYQVVNPKGNFFHCKEEHLQTILTFIEGQEALIHMVQSLGKF